MAVFKNYSLNNLIHDLFPPEKLSLYFHIPFCERKCGYCDFYSITNLQRTEDFVNAVIREMQLYSGWFEERKPVDTVFFGGGTPGILSLRQLERIFTAIEQCFDLSVCREITLETNPGLVTSEKLHSFRAMGINRLSMGVQSFRDEELHFLGRIHDAETAVESVQIAAACGFEQINIDLMTAFQGQTVDTMLFNLKTAVGLPISHISVYTLILEENTPFFHQYRKGNLTKKSDEEEREYYEKTMEFLEKYGFVHYEVSNFHRQNSHPCFHNLNYWTGKPYLGFGPSAHSFVPPYRWGNIRNLSAYLKSVGQGKLPLEFMEKLTPEDMRLEFLFLRLRLRQGFALKEYEEQFGEVFQQRYEERIKELVTHGLAVLENDRFCLTAKGILLAEEIAIRF